MVVTGSAVAIHEDTAVAVLKPLEMIGYMGLFGLMGMQHHFFDIKGECDGILLTIRLDEMKDIQSNHPSVYQKIMDFAASKVIDVLSYQYLGTSTQNQMRMASASIGQKRIGELFEFSGNKLLKQFWTGLENKEKIAFCRSVKFIEAQPKDVILQKQFVHSTLLIILKGQCVAIDEGNTIDGRIVLSQGSIFGTSQFLGNRPQHYNVYCRQKTVCLLINQPILEKICRDRSKIASNFYSLLVRHAALQIKNSFERVYKSPADDFFIEINMKMAVKKEQKQAVLQKKISQEFWKKYQVIPLHEKDFYKETVDNLKHAGFLDSSGRTIKMQKLESTHQTAKNPPTKQKTQAKDVKPQQNIPQYLQSINPKDLSQLQTFLSQKKHQLTVHVKKPKQRSGNIVKPVETIKNLSLERNLTEQQEENTAKRLEQLEQDNNSLKKDIEVLRSSISQLNHLIKSQSSKLISAKARLTMIEVFKELISRGQKPGGMLGSGTTAIVSLRDIFGQQLRHNNKYRLAAKCAYKWLYLTRKRLRLRGKQTRTILMQHN